MLVRRNQPLPIRRFRLRPDYIVPSVADIDFAELAKKGIVACFVDLDGTVVARGMYEVSPRTKTVLKTARQAVYIATNRPRSRDLKMLKEDLHATGVIHPHGMWPKPTRRYYDAALREHGLSPLQVVMIGDRYIQDIWGANNAGMYSLLISERLGPTHGWLDKLQSALDRFLTRMICGDYEEV